MKRTLIVIDMQNDFIDMALGTSEAVEIVPRVKAKIAEYIERGDEVIFTRDTHGEDYLQTTEGKNLPVEHCIRGTKGWEIADGLYVERCKIIDKPNFGWPHWDEEQLEEVELVGLCTDICVVSNALIIKATFPDAHIKVDATCCAGVTVESHEAALETMKMCQVEVKGFNRQMMTLEYYMRELKLMEQQYGQEEELYPLINILLRTSEYTKDLSIRMVANGKGNGFVKKILKGCAGFPDIVILDEKFDQNIENYDRNKPYMYGCVEAKDSDKVKMNDIELFKDKQQFKFQYNPQYCLKVRFEDSGNAKYTQSFKKADDSVNNKLSKISPPLKYDGWYYNINENDNKNELKDLNIEIPEGITTTQIKIDEINIGQVELDKNTKVNVDDTIKQLIGHLLWYKKVLYTDGIKWFFFELKDNDEELWDENYNWYEKINNRDIRYECIKLADLQKDYDEYKKKEYSDKTSKEWQKLISSLKTIDWTANWTAKLKKSPNIGNLKKCIDEINNSKEKE